MPLSKSAILAASDAQIERVNVPEWGGDVCVKVFNGVARDRVDAFLASRMQGGKLKDTTGLRVLVVSLSACDETGALLFSDADMQALADKSGRALDRVFNVACRLNGLSGGGIEEARADFLSGPSGESGTG